MRAKQQSGQKRGERATGTPACPSAPIGVLIVALPETAGSALYGLVDVLSAAGTVWQALTRHPEDPRPCFHLRIVSPEAGPFRCGHGIPVDPEGGLPADSRGQLVILPEMWLGPDESLRGRHPSLMEWLRRHHAEGGEIYSACSGSLLLAESGLLDGCAATSHWGYRDLFERDYPAVDFQPQPNLVLADAQGRIVTAGGTTSWHDLALHVIARHASPAEALRIAKVYLLKWHGEGQLPYTPLTRRVLHADAVVRGCEEWLQEHFREDDAIRGATRHCMLPERTLKRRFKQATGSALKDYVQNLRVEEAKHLLETTSDPVDAIGAAVGYEDASFFRRLFARLTGLTPGRYRRLFQANSTRPGGARTHAQGAKHGAAARTLHARAPQAPAMTNRLPRPVPSASAADARTGDTPADGPR